MSLSASDSNDCPQLLRAKKWCAHDFLQSHQMELCLIMIKKNIFFYLDFWSAKRKALSRHRIPLSQIDMISSINF